MSAARPRVPVRWLAQAIPAESLRIERILFEVLRDLCFGLGIAEGDVVRCRSVNGSIVLLETVGGRTVIIDQDWARFIEVSPAAPPIAAPSSASRSPSLSHRPAWRQRSARFDPGREFPGAAESARTTD